MMAVRINHLVPDRKPVLPTDDEGNVDRHRTLFAELLVRRFIADREVLRQYYHYVTRNSSFFAELPLPVHLDNVTRGLRASTPGQGEYW